MENSNLLNEESSKDSLIKKFFMLIGTILIGFFYLGILSYIVCSIAFLIDSYKLSSFYTSCYLWEYTLAYLLLLLIKFCLFKYDNRVFSIKFCNCLIMNFIEITYLLFGFSQLVFTDTTCNKINGTNLWYISICSLIIQLIITSFYSYFLLLFIYIEICKIKTPCCCIN